MTKDMALGITLSFDINATVLEHQNSKRYLCCVVRVKNRNCFGSVLEGRGASTLVICLSNVIASSSQIRDLRAAITL